MSEAELLNKLLHVGSIKRTYIIKSGENLRIDLPEIPITRDTQFVTLKKEKHGDVNSFLEVSGEHEGEGLLSPSRIYGKAVHSGKIEFTVKAIDRISGEEIPNVEPLNITVDIED